MSIEEELFKRSKIVLEKLEAYGFKEKGQEYFFKKKILDNTFEVIIKINKNLKLEGKIIDLSFNQEYINYRIETQNGTFVNTIREEYKKILVDIKNNCTISKYFITEQANRIASLIEKEYHDKPEFLWETSPGFGVFRNPLNLKWYALIMNIDKSKISNLEGEGEILNLKLEEAKISNLLTKKGFYKAYHTNKQNWITILLDDSISDSEIMSYIKESHSYTEVLSEWIVPANYSYYDVIGHFKNKETITWKQTTNVKVGDYVYMYIGSPISAILYKCQALKVNIPYNYHDKNIKMSKVMELKLIASYDKDKYTLDIMKKYGVKSVRCIRTITKELSNYINKNEKR